MPTPRPQNVRGLIHARTVHDFGLQTDNCQQSDEHIALFIARVRNRVDRYLYGPKPAFLTRLSWILTLQMFVISAVWYIWVNQILLPRVYGSPD